ncbi:DNA cytosine methyltransferase [Bacillus sp. S66]|nr:DNA cytosine methyltransferase [Bacillus sp. S66]
MRFMDFFGGVGMMRIGLEQAVTIAFLSLMEKK